MSTPEGITLAPDDDARVGWVRWLGAHMVGGIAGVGVGFLEICVFIDIVWWVHSLAYRLDLFFVLIYPVGLVAVTAASAASGAVGYGLCQILLQRKIKGRAILLYAAFCAFLWPVVFVLMTVFIALASEWPASEIMNKVSAAGTPIRELSTYVVLWVCTALGPGTALGLTLALCRRFFRRLEDAQRARKRRFHQATDHRPL